MKDILVYSDFGVDSLCLSYLVNTLYRIVHKKYNIKLVNKEYLLNYNWEECTDAFIMPGGLEHLYAQFLEGECNVRLKAFVENGGKYLGTCAGGYYGCAHVHIAPGTSNTLCASRPLAFFRGTASGPLFKPFVINSERGASAARVMCNFDNHTFPIKLYYNGGCYFKIDKTQHKNVDVLATYSDFNNEPATILCSVEKGMAILSGVHFEFLPIYLNKNDPYLKEIIPVLESTEDGRDMFCQKIFKLLNLI